MHKKPKYRKLTRQQKMLVNKQKREDMYKGYGIYIFENITNADLLLPKPTLGGQKMIPPKTKFRGDSFFMTLVKTRSLRLVEIIQAEEIVKNQNESINSLGDNMQNKLLLDQPDTVTNNGKIEHVQVETCPTNNCKINEEEEQKKNVLLVEDPVGSIEIIND